MNFICKACQFQSSSWAQYCPMCGSPSVVDEYTYARHLRAGQGAAESAAKTKSLPRVGTVDDYPDESNEWIKTGWRSVDYLLGGRDGGILPGAVYRVTAEPGCGKSTWLMQVAAATGATYCTAEETGQRLATRARRMGLRGMERVKFVIGASMYRAMREVREQKPRVVVVDSLQMFKYISEEEEDKLDAIDLKRKYSHDDAVTVAADWIKIAQELKCAVFLISHINKEGDAAGFQIIEHLIDCTVLILGDREKHPRVLKTQKNRTAQVSGKAAAMWMTKRGFIDAPKGDQEQALQRLIDAGDIEPSEEEEPVEPGESTFEEFEKQADAKAKAEAAKAAAEKRGAGRATTPAARAPAARGRRGR